MSEELCSRTSTFEGGHITTHTKYSKKEALWNADTDSYEIQYEDGSVACTITISEDSATVEFAGESFDSLAGEYPLQSINGNSVESDEVKVNTTYKKGGITTWSPK